MQQNNWEMDEKCIGMCRPSWKQSRYKAMPASADTEGEVGYATCPTDNADSGFWCS